MHVLNFLQTTPRDWRLLLKKDNITEEGSQLSEMLTRKTKDVMGEFQDGTDKRLVDGLIIWT